MNKNLPTIMKFMAVFMLAMILATLAGCTAQHVAAAPTSVTVVGSLQDELGCSGDWQPDCAATHLVFDADDDVWQGLFALFPGSFEYKAALNDSWDENYGASGQPTGPNIPLNLGGPTDVKFYYDHKSHWVTDDVNSITATAASSFQSELGCPGDWQPECLRSWLQDIDGDDIYTFTTDQIPAGDYEVKVALDEGWGVSYPGTNVAFNVPSAGDVVIIEYNSVGNQVSVTVDTGVVPPEIAALGTPPVRDSIQDEAQVQDRVAFHNTGLVQIPGLIVMSIADTDDTVADLDGHYEAIFVLVNANDEPQYFGGSTLAG